MIPPALLQALTNSCGGLWLGGQRRLVEFAIEQAYVQGFEDADMPAGALLRIRGEAAAAKAMPIPGQVIDAGSLAPGAEYRFTDRLRLDKLPARLVKNLRSNDELHDASLPDCMGNWEERYPNEGTEPDSGRRLAHQLDCAIFNSPSCDCDYTGRNQAADQVNGKAQGKAQQGIEAHG